MENKTIQKNEKGNIIYHYKLNEEEKHKITKTYEIDFHTLNSALDPEEVARFETEKDKIILIWKTPTSLKFVDHLMKNGNLPSFHILSIGLFLKKDELIVISSEKIKLFNKESTKEIKTLIDVVLDIQNNTIKHFIEHLKIIKLISRDLQKKINKSMENEYLLQMFSLSEVLIFYLDAINSNKIVLNRLLTHLKTIDINNNYIDFLNDIIIENEQASKQAEIYSQIFAGLMDARGTIVNNNMNVLIKNLTIINIIFLPLNLIASIGGMSEFTMMTEKIPWPISYGLLLIAMVIIGWLTFLIINKSSTKISQKDR